MESEEFENFFFATQSHVMTDDLLNALDDCVWPMVPIDVAIDYKKGKLVNKPSNEIYIWFMEFMRAVNIDDEFEVSAAQAKWLVQMAQEYDELEETEESDDRVLLVIHTFDDFANFQRIGNTEADSEDVFRVASEKSKK